MTKTMGFRDVSAAGLKTLFRLTAGQDVTGGMAGVALVAKGYVEIRDDHVPGAYYGYRVTDKGRDLVMAARKAGH